MVERLKIAIEKARQRREQQPGTQPAPATAAKSPLIADGGAAPPIWEGIPALVPDPAVLTRNRVVSFERVDPAYLVFDMLRTRIGKVCQDNGWTRIGITSPTKGCGKSLVSANLAFSIARHSEIRVALFDMDLRSPSLHRALGLSDAPSIGPFLEGAVPAESYLRRVGRNLALGLNGTRVRGSSELLQSSTTRTAIAGALEALGARIALFDLPPMLAGDDVVGFLPNLDCVMVVIGSGQTKAADVEECERLIEGNTAFLGVVLNRCTEGLPDPYSYEYGADEA